MIHLLMNISQLDNLYNYSFLLMIHTFQPDMMYNFLILHSSMFQLDKFYMMMILIMNISQLDMLNKKMIQLLMNISQLDMMYNFLILQLNMFQVDIQCNLML